MHVNVFHKAKKQMGERNDRKKENEREMERNEMIKKRDKEGKTWR